MSSRGRGGGPGSVASGGGGAFGGGGGGGGGGKGAGSEYECVIYCVAMQDADLARQRIQSLCDDGCTRVPEIYVRDLSWTRKNAERGMATGLSGTTEIRLRTTCGDQIKVGSKTQVCAAGQATTLPRVDQPERTEILHYNLFQLAHIKKLDTPVRSMVRIAIAGDTQAFLESTGFRRNFQINYAGERLLTRDGIEIDLFRRTKTFKSTTFIIPEGCASVGDSPLLISFRAIAASEAEIERTAKSLRSFVNEIKVGSSLEEVKPEHFLPRAAIR
ncbi:Hypothetical Protein FCC1311_112672 [Hondaea fermentalgiana]|uniref:Mediator of RNA polymerase II transcription subunit 18 n=1 Tax=Hondaea fermentalgiana TaxID=2315210 RepID=A0A2R5H3P5_9STRA|nr:Hypothetical Protein FCC1311_112672 [Hondaea fermentalgiana]|eukprot:GBG35044.1 Hypothetical Protein FCC1311_112672 [Hondaea fermentalgiana]